MSVEGPLFVVRRSVEAHFRIVILNRHSDSVFTEDLTTSEEFQYEVSAQNTVLYQNSRSEDRGIWFYDVSELRAFVSTIQPLIQSSTTRTTRPVGTRTSESTAATSTAPNNAASLTLTHALLQPQSISNDAFAGLLSPFDLNPTPTPATGDVAPLSILSLEEFNARLLKLMQDPAFVSKIYSDYVKRVQAQAQTRIS
eukprot:TRINITY_DN840_c0_g1_i2.p1 TRINITY_DN840_c0_g1~~TRINITY_DN840_c0_g1_i2.p1  ORF type:complete len:197 (-),score=7.18 TRINITY_DN840_c0_g1_i2:8-598(-)